MGIINAAANKGMFFSVRYACAINGQNFRPAVCYRLSGDLQSAVEEMQAKDLARIYPTEVRFVSGVAYPIRKPDAPKSVPASAPNGSVSQVIGSASATKAAGRKGKSGKSGFVEQSGREFY